MLAPKRPEQLWRDGQLPAASVDYRIEHGQWPTRLADLGDAALVDPFDGQPLKYVQTSNGHLVFSIGKNLRDDGGACDYETTDDVAFRPFDPEVRGTLPHEATDDSDSP